MTVPTKAKAKEWLAHGSCHRLALGDGLACKAHSIFLTPPFSLCRLHFRRKTRTPRRTAAIPLFGHPNPSSFARKKLPNGSIARSTTKIIPNSLKSRNSERGHPNPENQPPPSPARPLSPCQRGAFGPSTPCRSPRRSASRGRSPTASCPVQFKAAKRGCRATKGGFSRTWTPF